MSGLTFQEWTSDVDTSWTPVVMMMNSIELCTDGFKINPPPALETGAHVDERSGTVKS